LKSTTLFYAVVMFVAVYAGQDSVDLNIISRIKAEAFERSRVMDHAFYLTDVHGPRLTGSPGFVASAEWLEQRLREYSLINITRESFDWGRGWSLQRFSAELTTPQQASLIGFPLPWSPGTDGEIRGEPVLATCTEHLSERVLQEYFDRYRGRLKGRIVLFSEPRSLEPDTRSPMSRFTAEDLRALEQQWIPKTPRQPARSGPSFPELADRLIRFFKSEGVRMLIFQEWGKGGGVVEADRPFGANWLRHRQYELPPPMVVLSAEHYNRLARLVTRGISTQVAININSRFIEPAPAFNLTADIPGTDKAEEFVLIGAHLDSWTGATGATDNAAGVAVMTEVMRILKAIGFEPRRTIRLALWGGHEGEGLGARTYVNAHYGTSAAPKPMHGKVTCYFNLDNGTGRIRGIYLQNNEALRPIFTQWFEPFRSMGATTVSINSVGGTDHGPFDTVGIPAFQFIQDPVEYATRTHHTNMDVYDRLQEEDLKQASAIIASFVYLAANRQEMLPRKQLSSGLR
jgi:carboxypeptidase Q